MILYVLSILSLILTIIAVFSPYGFAGSNVTIWELPVYFIVIFLILFLITGLFSVCLCMTFNKDKNYTSVPGFINFWFHRLLEAILSVLNIHVRAEGMELIEGDGPYLIVQNHRSMFDAVASLVLFEKLNPIAISKPENLKLPVVGPYMHRMRYMAIDREDPRKAMKTIMEAARLMKEEGQSILIYPEGTRNTHFLNGKKPVAVEDITVEDRLLPFHNGVFKIAQMANAPVIVSTVEGSEEITSKIFWRKSRMQITINRVISAREVVENRTNTISELAQEAMQASMNDHIEHKRK